MTDIDSLKIERDAARQRLDDIEVKLATAESNRSIEHARKAFKALATDESLPVLRIIEQVLTSWSESETARRAVGPHGASEFIERLLKSVECNS